MFSTVTITAGPGKIVKVTNVIRNEGVFGPAGQTIWTKTINAGQTVSVPLLSHPGRSDSLSIEEFNVNKPTNPLTKD